jgi:hypothetical protein
MFNTEHFILLAGRRESGTKKSVNRPAVLAIRKSGSTFRSCRKTSTIVVAAALKW